MNDLGINLTPYKSLKRESQVKLKRSDVVLWGDDMYVTNETGENLKLETHDE